MAVWLLIAWLVNLGLGLVIAKQRARIGWLEGRRRKQYRPRLVKPPEREV
jgi:hypothetical protein